MSEFRNFDGEIVPAQGVLLRQQAERHGDRLFSIIDDESITYTELYARALAAAKGVRALGVKTGDRIGVFLPNCIDFMVAYFAGHIVGAVVVTINARYKVHELSYAIAFADIKLLFTTDRIDEHVNFGDLLFETLPDLVAGNADQPLQLAGAPELKHVVLLGHSMRDPFMSMEQLSNVGMTLDAEAVAALPHQGDVDDIAVTLFTSGTTSAPKACQLTHRSIYQTWVRTYPREAGLAAGEKIWVPMPCFHVGGIGLAAGVLAHGACFLSSIFHQPRAALNLLKAHRPEHLYPGFFILMLPILKEPDYQQGDFAQARTMVAIAPYDTHMQMKALMPEGITVFQLFGMTEAAGYVCFTPGAMPEEQRLRCSGMPVDGCEVRVVNENDNTPIPLGEDGEIQFRGANRFHSYYKNDAANADTILQGGWVKTGDCGRLAQDGSLTFRGRLKDMLKVGGENVAAAEIEGYLGLHPAVKLAQVVGRDDEFYGDVPVAFVELMPGQTVAEEELISFCRNKLASFKVPKAVIFVDEWPMSATKIQKFRLKESLKEIN